jgi:hypothetical protein
MNQPISTWLSTRKLNTVSATEYTLSVHSIYFTDIKITSAGIQVNTKLKMVSIKVKKK